MSFFSLYVIILSISISSFFFFNDTATTEIYTLSLHDALPISQELHACIQRAEILIGLASLELRIGVVDEGIDRKSTRLNSSHQIISYAVFCLKKKNKPCMSA